MGGQGALDSEALFSKIKEKIKVKERSNPAFRDDRKDWEFQRKRRGYKKWYAIAAVMVLVGCLAFWGAKMDKSEHSMPVQKIEMITKSTSIGQKLQLTLVDGSHVYLNAGSKLIFPRHFDDQVREVYLEGEAFFDVERDEQRPFIVKTPNTTTRVLGTSFVVKESGHLGETKVGVLTGKVKVTNNVMDENSERKLQFTLLPMEAVSYSYVDGSMTKSRVEYDEMFAWKDNIISFKAASFQEVIAVLTKWYGVRFDIRKGFSSSKDFTGRFEHESLDHVLEGLSFTFQFNYRIEKEKILIY